MSRHGWNGVGKPKGGTKICTYCGRSHPKGKKKRIGWKGCHTIAISKKEKTSDPTTGNFSEGSAKRKTKCQLRRQRTAERKSLGLTKSQYYQLMQERKQGV